MWLDVNNERLRYSDDELRNKLLAEQPNFNPVILDGPTMCGKTRFLKSLPTEITTVVGFYRVYEDFCDWLNDNSKKQGRLTDYRKKIIREYQNKGLIICFEDIDILLAGRETTQQEFSLIFTELAETSTVILTGIDIKAKCPVLLHPSSHQWVERFDYYKWIES